MKKMMHLLVDVRTQTVTNVLMAPSLQNWYREIGCSMVEVVNVAKYGVSLVVDEEGCMKKPEGAFSFGGWDIVGNALIISEDVDDEGGSLPVCKNMTPERMAALITFHPQVVAEEYAERSMNAEIVIGNWPID